MILKSRSSSNIHFKFTYFIDDQWKCIFGYSITPTEQSSICVICFEPHGNRNLIKFRTTACDWFFSIICNWFLRNKQIFNNFSSTNNFVKIKDSRVTKTFRTRVGRAQFLFTHAAVYSRACTVTKQRTTWSLSTGLCTGIQRSITSKNNICWCTLHVIQKFWTCNHDTVFGCIQMCSGRCKRLHIKLIDTSCSPPGWAFGWSSGGARCGNQFSFSWNTNGCLFTWHTTTQWTNTTYGATTSDTAPRTGTINSI